VSVFLDSVADGDADDVTSVVVDMGASSVPPSFLNSCGSCM
jgi:hypothetical protein